MTRYNIEGRSDCDGDEIPPIIEESSTGLWVKWDDVEKLLKILETGKE